VKIQRKPYFPILSFNQRYFIQLFMFPQQVTHKILHFKWPSCFIVFYCLFLLIYKFYPNLYLMDGCTSHILHKITTLGIICSLQDSILFSLAPYPFFLDLNTLKDFLSVVGGHLPYEKFLPTKDWHLEKQNVCRSFVFLCLQVFFCWVTR